MCGIVGILYSDRHWSVDPDILKAMGDSIAHRGPDAEGFWIEPGIGLAHRRLSIIDLAGGKQPVGNEDGSIHVVFNVETYNEQPGVWSRVTIGSDSWIGEHATIMADIGKHCVIGAGSVVTHPIPDYAIAVGVPARVIRYRNQDPAANRTATNGKGSPLILLDAPPQHIE